MAKEVYTINGQRYEVEVKESSRGKQKLVINGQEIVLQSAKVIDTTNKDGMNVELRIAAGGNHVELGETRLDFAYLGPYKEEINAVMRERVERGSATQMERVAVYQQQYNNRAIAEALASGKSANDADLLKLTEAQINGQEPLPDIKKRFPWAYAGLTERAMDTVKQAWDKDAAFRVNCRKHLSEIREDMFDTMHRDGNKVIIRDRFALNEDMPQTDLHRDLAMQERTVRARANMEDSREDEVTDRLMAAVDEKNKSKETKTRRRTSVQQISNDYDRA